MAQKTRRDFLEQSMLTAAAAAVAGAPTFVPAEDAQSTSPNERLQVACIGVRGRGQSHLSAFSRRKDTEVVAVVADHISEIIMTVSFLDQNAVLPDEIQIQKLDILFKKN